MKITKKAPKAADKAARKRTRDGGATSAATLWTQAVADAYADEIKAGEPFEQVLGTEMAEWANGFTPTKATTRAKKIGNGIRPATKGTALDGWVAQVFTSEPNAKIEGDADYVRFRPATDAERAAAKKASERAKGTKAAPAKKATSRKRTPKK